MAFSWLQLHSWPLTASLVTVCAVSGLLGDEDIFKKVKTGKYTFEASALSRLAAQRAAPPPSNQLLVGLESAARTRRALIHNFEVLASARVYLSST